METGTRVARFAREALAPTLGMACFWCYLRFPAYLRLLYPMALGTQATSGAGADGAGFFAFVSFLAVLVVLAVCGLAGWRAVTRTVEGRGAAVGCCALVGAAASVATFLATHGLAPSWLAWAMTPLVALAFLACLFSWATHFSVRFGAREAFVCVLSYLVSLVLFSPVNNLGTFGLALVVAIVPLGSALGWLAATRPTAANEGVPQTDGPNLRPLLNPVIWLFVAFLLAGSIERGIVDIMGAQGMMRFRISLPVTALLTLVSAGMVWARRRTSTETIAPFTLGCWAVFSLMLFVGVFALVAFDAIYLGGNLVVVARSMLEIALWVTLCDLAFRKRVAPVPLFAICCAGVEAASWALSYVAVPVFLSGTPGDPEFGTQMLALFTLFALAGVVTIILGFTLVALGRKRSTIAPGDWLPSGDAAAAAPVSAPSPATADAALEEELERALEQRRGLTAREASVAVRYAHGFSLAKVSEGLGITTSAAQTHIKSAYRKLGVHSKDELIEAIDRLRREE